MKIISAELQVNNEANNSLTCLASVLHDAFVARTQDVLSQIRDALAVDAKRMREISGEMHKLADAHHRYVALQREAKSHEESSRALIALLGVDAFFEAMQSDSSDAIGEEIDRSPHVTDLRASAPLWQHIQQYLRFVPEAQVLDIVGFLGMVKIRTSRQAIESAVETHPKIFAVKKRGREKFVSLK